MPLMAAIAGPKGEQAKTDIDRIKKDIGYMRANWQLEDKENNQSTIRAYRLGKLVCEMYLFSLMPNTSLESKTLNVLAIEESHKAAHKKITDECDPMLASTNGCTWHFGVGCPRRSQFLEGCAGRLLESIAVQCAAEEVIRDRREVYEKTGDPYHLNYEKKFRSDLRKKGRNNPEIRRNYFLEDTVEEGNFISRERLLKCARTPDKVVPLTKLFCGIDWARRSDYTWVTIVNDKNDVIDWNKVPHVTYPEQVTLINEWLLEPRKDFEGKEYRYIDRIYAFRGDATGAAGDAPNEILQLESSLPIDDDSFFVFGSQSKNDLYVNFELYLFKDDPFNSMKFSYPADHEHAAEFEDQMTNLIRDYTGKGQYLAVHHPKDDPEAKDDAPDSTALALMAAKNGGLGEILIG